MSDAAGWLARIRALPLSRPIRVLNVCGGHEHALHDHAGKPVRPREDEHGGIPALPNVPGRL